MRTGLTAYGLTDSTSKKLMGVVFMEILGFLFQLESMAESTSVIDLTLDSDSDTDLSVSSQAK